jgi:hypothetical protein
MQGPIINRAYGSEMRATAFSNNCCVSEVTEHGIMVFREKLYTISSNLNTTTDFVSLKNSSSSLLIELKEFILYYLTKANQTKSLVPQQIIVHENAIEVIEVELNSRIDKEKQTTIFLLKKMIEQKEFELNILKNQLNNLK